MGLRRTKNGQFTLRDAVRMRELHDAFAAGDWYKHLIPAADTLADWYTIELTPEQAKMVKNGHRIPLEDEVTGWARAISQQGDLIAILEVLEDSQEWQPRKVFVTT